MNPAQPASPHSGLNLGPVDGALGDGLPRGTGQPQRPLGRATRLAALSHVSRLRDVRLVRRRGHVAVKADIVGHRVVHPGKEERVIGQIDAALGQPGASLGVVEQLGEHARMTPRRSARRRPRSDRRSHAGCW